MSDRDTSFVRHLCRQAIFRYTAVAVIAFTVGSAGVVIGANVSSSPIFRLGDATNAANVAAVDGSGQLHTSDAAAQAKLDSANTALGTANTNLGTINTSVGATNTALSTANASLTAANKALGTANTTLGTVNTQLGKLTFDGSGNLKTAVSNLPAVTSGVTVIPLATVPGIGGGGNTYAEWVDVDVSACRSFSVAVNSLGSSVTKAPSALIVRVSSDAGFAVEADVHQKGAAFASGTGWSLWGFPTEPGTNEPFYATSVSIFGGNGESFAVDMSGAVFCSH